MVGIRLPIFSYSDNRPSKVKKKSPINGKRISFDFTFTDLKYMKHNGTIKISM